MPPWWIAITDMTDPEREDQTVHADMSQIIAEDENEDYEAEDDEAYGAEL